MCYLKVICAISHFINEIAQFVYLKKSLTVDYKDFLTLLIIKQINDITIVGTPK